MKTGWKTIILVVVLGGAAAHADASYTHAVETEMFCASDQSQDHTATPPSSAATWDVDEVSLQDVREADRELSRQAKPDKKPIDLKAPDAGSATLFLMYACGWGFWRMSRSAGKLNLANAPMWFHTEGPVQIGHTVLSDLNFGYLAVSRFEPIITPEPQRVPVEPARATWHDQCTPGVLPTRGPPIAS